MQFYRSKDSEDKERIPQKKTSDHAGIRDRDRERERSDARDRERDRERERRDSGGVRVGPSSRYNEGAAGHHSGSWTPRFPDKRFPADPRGFDGASQTHRPYRPDRVPRIHEKRRYCILITFLTQPL